MDRYGTSWFKKLQEAWFTEDMTVTLVPRASTASLVGRVFSTTTETRQED
jgi:hypothetical protein